MSEIRRIKGEVLAKVSINPKEISVGDWIDFWRILKETCTRKELALHLVLQSRQSVLKLSWTLKIEPIEKMSANEWSIIMEKSLEVGTIEPLLSNKKIIKLILQATGRVRFDAKEKNISLNKPKIEIETNRISLGWNIVSFQGLLKKGKRFTDERDAFIETKVRVGEKEVENCWVWI